MNNQPDILTTNGVTISVRTAFVPEHSSIDQNHYVFAYEITIQNHNDFPVQLISRNWLITDALLNQRQVSGIGVIGEQPIILPNEEYTYISGCHFKTPFGKMKGSYQMVNKQNHQPLTIQIPEFTMYCPYFLN